MRPDYCPLWNEPCQKGCDPKCGTMNAWEALRKELVALLRQGRGARRPRTRGVDRRGSLQDIVSIHMRPPEANVIRIFQGWR
mgnify:CR=1 FL=1